MSNLRVVSWNVRFAGLRHAEAQAQFLRSLQPQIVLLQEVNAGSLAAYRDAAGLDWLTCSRAEPLGNIERKRQAAAAIGGRGARLVRTLPALPDAPLSERIHQAIVQIGEQEMTVASYYAPPGVSFGYQKVENALAFLAWMQNLAGPIVVGADANSPKIDHPDSSLTRSWWHTGTVMMRGRPGDDGLWGPNAKHKLQDALRLWLKAHPTELAAIATARPQGPLAISHWTGRRRLVPEAGTPRRYDAIWVSPEFTVTQVAYRVDSMPELSDHAAVVADLVKADPLRDGGHAGVEITSDRLC